MDKGKIKPKWQQRREWVISLLMLLGWTLSFVTIFQVPLPVLVPLSPPLPVACFSYIRFKEPFYTYAPFTLSQTFIQNTVRFNAKPNHFDDFFGHNFVFPAGGSVLRRSLKAWLQRTYSTWA